MTITLCSTAYARESIICSSFFLYFLVHDFLCFLILVIIFDFFPYVDMMS